MTTVPRITMRKPENIDDYLELIACADDLPIAGLPGTINLAHKKGFEA